MTKPTRTLRIIALIGCSILSILFLWHFMRTLQISKYFGGKQNIEIITSPDCVNAFATIGYLQRSTSADPLFDYDRKSSRVTRLPPSVVQPLSKLLLAQSSYEMNPLTHKESIFAPELILEFRKADRMLDLFVCLQSADVLVKSADGSERLLDLCYVHRELKQLLNPYVNRSSAK